MVVWKYILNRGRETKIEIPKGAKLLSVAFNDRTVNLWALVKPENSATTRTFECKRTGQDVDSGLRYVGTCIDQVNDSSWHVFER